MTDYYSTRIGGRPARDIPDIKGLCHICLRPNDNKPKTYCKECEKRTNEKPKNPEH